MFGRSPATLEAGRTACDNACATIASELRAPFTCEARLLEGPVVTDRDALRDGCCYLVLALAAEGKHALVELDEGFAAAVADRLAGGPGLISAPGELTRAEAAALGFLSLSALRTLRRVAFLEDHFAIRLDRVARSSEEVRPLLSLEESWLAVDLALELGDAFGTGRLLLPAGLLERVLERTPGVAERTIPDAFAQQSLPAQLCVGRSELLPADAESLSPGDVVLVDGIRREDQGVVGRAVLRFESFHLHGAFDGRAFTLAPEGAITTESVMPIPSQPPPLPVEVEVELARLRIPLSELSQLEPGAILGLDVTLAEPVLLRIGGRAVARAELVDIEGELGARILSILS
jgi:type III secretion protein Q